MSEQKHIVVVGDKEYELIKKGLAQAEQVTNLSKWLATYGLPIFEELSGGDDDTTNTELFKAVLNNLSTDALIQLFVLVIGCSKRIAEQEFDIGILVDSILIIWEEQPGLRNLVNRFFSTQN